MKSNKIKFVVVVIAFLGLASTTTSCNRGYGCPNNFSIDNGKYIVQKVVSTGLDAIVK